MVLRARLAKSVISFSKFDKRGLKMFLQIMFFQEHSQTSVILELNLNNIICHTADCSQSQAETCSQPTYSAPLRFSNPCSVLKCPLLKSATSAARVRVAANSMRRRGRSVFHECIHYYALPTTQNPGLKRVCLPFTFFLLRS